MPIQIASSETRGIRVSVQACFIQDESAPQHGLFVFAYQVKITNQSAHTVQLRSRRWDIIEVLGERKTVTGEGVVGQQPILAPRQSHTYVSGCNLSSPIGQMAGHYVMENRDSPDHFHVRIPAFTLIAPWFHN